MVSVNQKHSGDQYHRGADKTKRVQCQPALMEQPEIAQCNADRGDYDDKERAIHGSTYPINDQGQ